MSLFVAQVYPRAEGVAEYHLRQQGFGVDVLRQTVRVVERGAWVEKSRLLLPGHVFVSLNLSVDRWQAVNHTRGVKRLLPIANDRPIPLRDDILAILGRLTSDEQWLKVGQMLRVIAGPIKGLNVNCVNVDGKHNFVDVEFTLLQRGVMVRLDVNDVVPCTDEP
jgi:transcription antitermination factor NusG